MESESPRIRVLTQSRSLSFERDSSFLPYLSCVDFHAILLLSICLLCNLFYKENSVTALHLLLEELKKFSRVILKCTIVSSHKRNKSWSLNLILGLELESRVQDFLGRSEWDFGVLNFLTLE